MTLIGDLEKAWKTLRYGEGTLKCEGKDFQLAKDLVDNLLDAYNEKTGIFPKRKKER